MMPVANSNSRDEALPLLLPWPLRHPLVQDPVDLDYTPEDSAPDETKVTLLRLSGIAFNNLVGVISRNIWDEV